MASTDGVSVLFDVVAEGRGIQLFYNPHSLHRQRNRSSVHFHQLGHLRFSWCVASFFFGAHFTVGSVAPGYHFIQMLNRPVDLPLGLVVVRVVESITLTKTNRRSKHSGRASLRLQSVAPSEASRYPSGKSRKRRQKGWKGLPGIC